MRGASFEQVDKHLAVLRDDVTGTTPSTLKESGIDWITVTCSDPDSRSRFQEFGCSMLHVETGLGEEVSTWRFQQFEGLKAGGAAYGEAEDMACIRLSGPTAHAHWRRAHALSTSCSRIDLQVTVANVEDVKGLIATHYAELMDHFKSWLKPPTIDLRWSNRTGATLYLGTRQSDRFGRIYDKGIESKMDHYRGCARYEIQFNGESAKLMARSITRDEVSRPNVEGKVLQYYSERGLRLSWPCAASSLLSRPRKRTTDARRLRWLNTQVAPAVKDLMARNDLPAILEALGLSAVAGPLDHKPD